jgi:hypothetical protein
MIVGSNDDGFEDDPFWPPIRGMVKYLTHYLFAASYFITVILSRHLSHMHLGFQYQGSTRAAGLRWRT